MGVSTSGLLSVVARNYPESPEKQYDRLVCYFHEIAIFPCQYYLHEIASRLCLRVPPLSVKNPPCKFYSGHLGRESRSRF